MKGKNIMAMLVLAMFLIPGMPATLSEAKMPASTESTARTVLAECFTATWCGYCPAAEGALNRLANEMSRDQLAIIEWHLNDGYEAPDGSCSARADYYGVQGIPTTFFDGLDPEIGGSTNPNDNTVYTNYKNKINSRLSVPSPVAISISGYINGDYGIVNAQITVLDPLPASTNGTYVHFVLCEDQNRSVVVSGRTYWLRFDAVKSLGMDLLNIGVGQTLSLQKNFTIDGSWEADRLWIVVFVQNHDRVYHGGTYSYYTSEIYQSSTLNLSAQPILETHNPMIIPLTAFVFIGALVFSVRRYK